MERVCFQLQVEPDRIEDYKTPSRGGLARHAASPQ